MKLFRRRQDRRKKKREATFAVRDSYLDLNLAHSRLATRNSRAKICADILLV